MSDYYATSADYHDALDAWEARTRAEEAEREAEMIIEKSMEEIMTEYFDDYGADYQERNDLWIMGHGG